MARQEDSGLIDLDALLRQASESERELARPAPPPPAQAAPVAAPPPPPAPAAAPPTPDESVPATSIRTAAAANASAPIATPPRSSRRTLATVAALAALLCAALIGYRASSGGDVGATLLPAHAPKTTTARAIEPPAVPDSHASPGIAAGDLPSAPSPSSSSAPGVAPEPARHAAQPSQPSQPSQPRVAAVVLPDSPKAELSDLGAAMRGAVGANDGTANAAAPIATGAAARTLHPSPGAMVGAINGVLPAARACLGADDPVRVASVTFRSDGAVALVEFDGERATDACVRSALARSHVEPFVDPTFVTRVTVRP
ncbi:MAG: Fe-S oxidoreductase [Myxococcaceae bacterium]|nr:Fe-S oxidoreductase [Myxococcaceae bacterium]